MSALCRHCALCCDGSLFGYVGLEPGDAERLRAKAFCLATRPGGQTVLAQPCAALTNRSCRIYESRPSHCASFNCLLATALGEEELSLGEAQEVVAEAHRRISRGHARGYLRTHFYGRYGQNHESPKL